MSSVNPFAVLQTEQAQAPIVKPKKKTQPKVVATTPTTTTHVVDTSSSNDTIQSDYPTTDKHFARKASKKHHEHVARDGKRQFDKNDGTSYKKTHNTQVKKGGSGKGNWGNFKDGLEETIAEAEGQLSADVTDTKGNHQESETEEDDEEARLKAEEELHAKMMTIQEYKASQAAMKAKKRNFNVRKPNEGQEDVQNGELLVFKKSTKSKSKKKHKKNNGSRKNKKTTMNVNQFIAKNSTDEELAESSTTTTQSSSNYNQNSNSSSSYRGRGGNRGRGGRGRGRGRGGRGRGRGGRGRGRGGRGRGRGSYRGRGRGGGRRSNWNQVEDLSNPNSFPSLGDN